MKNWIENNLLDVIAVILFICAIAVGVSLLLE